MFASEAEFDAHKVEQVRIRRGDRAAAALERLLQPLQQQYSEKFVLTHGDLHSENVHLRCVTDSKGKFIWELSGILDWGNSGFYPGYMEYAVAMKSGPYYPYWRKVMKKLLKGMECTKDRVRLQETATDWTV